MNNEFREALETVVPVLQKHSVDFLIIGGTAVNIYGHQRISGGHSGGKYAVDLDFWFNPTISNYLNLVNALKDLKVDTSSFESGVFDPKKTFLKIPCGSFHMDFLSQVLGLGSFRDAKKDATIASFAGQEVKVIAFADLVKSKEAVNRQIDKDDIAELKKKRKGRGL